MEIHETPSYWLESCQQYTHRANSLGRISCWHIQVNLPLARWEVFRDSHIHTALPHAGDSPSAYCSPPGQMEGDGLTLHQWRWRWWIWWPNSAGRLNSDGQNEALQVSSMQLSSRGLGRGGCTFSISLLSHVHFKKWKADCIYLCYSIVIGFTTAATTSWEQSHPLNLLRCTWGQRTQKDSSKRTETSKYLIFILRSKDMKFKGHQSCLKCPPSVCTRNTLSQTERERRLTQYIQKQFILLKYVVTMDGIMWFVW